jgi:4-amino-4-deoxy-L-arabinose transferase-like glycosyltransferase
MLLTERTLWRPDGVASIRRRLLARPFDALICALLVVLTITVALTYDRYGFTIDEDNCYARASRVVQFITSFGRNVETLATFDIHDAIHGAMPDTLALLLQRFIPALSFDSRHLVSAMFGVGGIYYAYRVGATFITPAVGFFAALFLASNPMWFGYMFINTKDIPFATMLLCAFYYCLRALAGRYESPWIWVKVGLSIGLLATIKLFGVLVLYSIFLVGVIFLLIIPNVCSLQIYIALLGRLLAVMASTIVGCLVCFTIFWPQFYFYSYLQLANVVGPFKTEEISVQINGQRFRFDRIPWYYLSTYWSISMPLFLLVLTAAGAAAGVIRREPLIMSLVLVSVAFFAGQAITGALVYNGYRHFLFLLPFAMLIAAYSIGFLLSAHVSLMMRITALAVVVVGVATTILTTYQLFPYQYSFYNVLVGGVAGADGRFYIDVWRSALREALRKADESISDRSGIVRIFTCGSDLTFSFFPRFERVKELEEADYIIALRMGCGPERFTELPVVADVRRQGVLFATIHTGKKPTLDKLD